MKVGAEIESVCRKCGDVWHVVLAMKESAVAKVECKDCGAQHRYRAPAGTAAPKKAAKKKRAPAKKKAARASEAEPEGPRVQPDMDRPVKPYGLTKSFEVADRIEHRTFGVGTVEILIGEGKLEAWFDGGRRMLAHNRKA